MIRYARVRSNNEGIYVGRKCAGYSQSPLANPYKATEIPGATLPAYKAWLWGQIKDANSPASREITRLAKKVKSGEDIVLSCWCTDHTTCHSSVIKAAVEWTIRK